jgi:branched-chain amino acid transport system permease protein
MFTVEVVLQVMLSGLLMGAVYALIAIGFTLVFGVLDIVNFAHGHLVMAAMFVTYVLYQRVGIDPYASLVLVLPLFFVLGLVIYRVVISAVVEAPHAAHIIVTIGLFIFIENLANFMFGGDLRGVTLPYTTSSFVVGTIAIPVARLAAAGVSVLAVAALALFLRHTDFGMAIRAAANNRTGAHLVGVNVKRVYLVAFAIATMIAALAGAVLVPFSLVSPFVSGDFMLKAFAIAIIGGLGSVPGAFLGGLLIGLVEAFSSLFFQASLGNAIVFGILIAVLLFKPSGLLGRATT